MKLTRTAWRNEAHTLSAQLDMARQEIDRLQADLYEAQRVIDEQPALADNIRLASKLEKAEQEIETLTRSEEMQTRRLAKFVAAHPHLFDVEP